ncbi:MAG TPA: hypothetical protein VND94_23225 [Terriglobia bacterium]|nr:hypothetical protein [Terriglobia bacterium]
MTDRATVPLQQPARAEAPLDPAAPGSAPADTRPAQLAKDDGLKVPEGSPSAAPPSGEDEAARAAPAPASAPAPGAADPLPSGASGRVAPFGNIAPPAPPPDLQQRLDEAAKIADPHLRQAVEANIRLLTQRERTAFTDQQRAAKAQAKGIIDQGGDLGSIPAKVLLQIDQSGRQALHDYAAAHGNPRTDPVTYYALKNQALDDPAAFQGVDLGDHMARLDAKDYGELTQLQTSLRNGQPPADLPLQQVYKANTDRMLQQLGLPSVPAISAPANDAAQGPQRQDTTTPPIDPQSLQAATQLRRDVDQALAAHQVVQGRPATPAEQQQFLDQAVISRYGTRYRMNRMTTVGTSGSIDVQNPLRTVSDHLSPSAVVPITATQQADAGAEQSTAGQRSELDPSTAPTTSASSIEMPDDTDAARKRNILAGSGGRFVVSDNPKANENWPLVEAPEDIKVLQFDRQIEAAAGKTGVDADLIRAIMYMETSHGGYDRTADELGMNKSILPMNVNVTYWGDHFGTREQLHDPYLNVLAGARMLRAIENNVPPGTDIAKIATLYNNHRARYVSDYGARVAKIYRQKLWLHQPAPRWPRVPQLFKRAPQ